MAYEILWRLHAVLMSTAFAALFSGIFISLFYRKKKWRYKTHRNLGILAGISGVSALVIAFIMVQVFSGTHFTSLHAIVGGTTGLLLILSPLVGLRIRKSRKKKRMRLSHRTLGYATLVMMILTIPTGLIFAGILTLPSQATGGDSNPEVVLTDNSIKIEDITFSWKIENGYLEGTLQAPGDGWVAVGFNPRNMMEGADFIIGYVADGEVHIRDDFGDWYTSHNSDESLGGLDNIEILGGHQDETGTVLQFRKLLDTGDEYDHVFVPGQEIPVIFAYSDEDSYSGMHKRRGKATITF
jgi:hypothetical protein